jgi:SAM-dependent methyltransferase
MLSSRDLNAILDRLNRENLLRSGIEVEAKFGFYYDDGGFASRVRWPQFNRLQERLENEFGFVPIREQSVDYSQADIRKRVIETPEGSQVVWQRKNRGPSVIGPIYDYGVRISVNIEQDIDALPDFEPSTIRIKERKSYLFSDSIRIDTTQVEMSYPGSERSSQTSYEVEVEILDLPGGDLSRKLVQFNTALQQVFQILYDTIALYTVSERDRMIQDVQRILGQRRGRWLDFGMVAQARNLKLRDMVWGGLAGNLYREKDNPYSVTHKTDGLRKFLIIHETGIWLAFPPYEYSLLIRFDTGNHDWSLRGTILDGEVILPDQRRPSPHRDIPQAYYWFLTFDMLADRGDKRIQFRPHSERMQRASKTIHKMRDADDPQNKILTIHMKEFRQIKSPKQFFSLMREMMAEKALLPYEEDGFIFTPEAALYNPLRTIENSIHRQLRLDERVLTRYPDICKWKPLSKLTIDFSIAWKKDDVLELYAVDDVSGSSRQRSLVAFEGDSLHPFEETMVDISHPTLRDLPTGTIVEFAWDPQRSRFYYYKTRSDKKLPNRLSIAIDDWQDIHRPIQESTLTGRDFVLLQRYHNRLKRDLFRQVERGSYLLDIGSGRGGDIAKWKRFDKIVAVEPNPDHIVELRRRLKVYGMEDRVRVVQARGQDSDIIRQAVKEFTGDNVDVVSVMLSLTFFWENEEVLRGLARTIEENLPPRGRVLFLTMDGDTVEQVFEPYFPNYTYDKLIFHQSASNPDEGYAVLKLQDVSQVDYEARQGRKLSVYIQDSIVGSRKSSTARQAETITGSVAVNPISSALSIRYVEAPVMRLPQAPVTLVSGTEKDPRKRIRYTNAPVMRSAYTPARYQQVFETPSPSTIQFQEEYLVHLSDLERELSRHGDLEKRIFRADGEYFLSEAEKRFSLMYSWGWYDIRGKRSYE